MKEDWEIYEHFCIDYHREKYNHITWHWYNTPEEHLENSGYIHSFNKHRLERLRKYKELRSDETQINNHRDYGMDGLAMELRPEENKIYHGLQMKYYQKGKVTASDIGTFMSSLFCRLLKNNPDSRGYLYSSNGLEINLHEDLQNNPLIIYEKVLMEKNNEEKKSIEIDETSYPLRPYQIESIKELHNFDNNDDFSFEDSDDEESIDKKSKIKTLSLFCGGGKTLIAGNYLKDIVSGSKSFELIIVMAPLKISVDNLYTRLTPFLKNYKTLVVDSDYTIGTTDPITIENFINDKSKPSIIYTTFDSAENLISSILAKSDNEIFKSGFILVDEVHNLIGNTKLENFVNNFNDGLLLSATIPEEIYENINTTNVYSYNISQAIKDKYCVDYKIWLPLIIQNESESSMKSIEIPKGFPENEICEKALFLVTGMLKTGAKRCIVYLNSREECDIFNELFSKVCSEYQGISSWTEKIDCGVSLENRRKIIEEFQSEKIIKNTLHILSSVRILDEAIDIIRCDSEFIGSVGEKSSDIRCVQRLFRGGRLDKSNVHKINNLFIWTKEVPNVVNMLSLLRDSDPEFHKKVSVLDGSYDSSGKNNSERIILKKLEIENVRKSLEIKCLNYLDYHKTILNQIKDFKEKYGEYPKNKENREPDESKLFNYIGSRRKDKKKGNLNRELEKLILDILPDWIWDVKTIYHINMINKIKIFREEHNHYPKEYSKDKEEKNLYNYICGRRTDKKNNTLNPEVEKLFLKYLPDFLWNPIMDKHILILNQIKEFKLKYGTYPLFKGTRDEENEDKLSSYIFSRRKEKKKNILDLEIELLINKIFPDWIWETKKEHHILIINQIKGFKLKYKEYPKTRGIRDEENESKLASYISSRRQDKKKNKLSLELEEKFKELLPDLIL